MGNIDRYSVFQQMEAFRLFEAEYKQVCKVVKHSKTIENGKKYDNKSHFYRVAIMKLLKEEIKELDIKAGRPKGVRK